jgi:hypothetical protein
MVTLSMSAMEIVQKKIQKNLTASGQFEKVTAHTENKIRTMRTKSLLFAAAVGLAGVASAVAQNNVYSVNAVGYVNLTVPSGFSMIANPLNSTNNTIGTLVTLPRFSQLFKWNGTGFDIATMSSGGWDHPEYTLAPGEGAFVSVSSQQTLTFVGEVLQGNLTNAIPAGFAIRSSQVPQTGSVTALGLTPALKRFDQLFKWNAAAGQYDIYSLASGGVWSPTDPIINVGESFFLSTSAGGSWSRTFSVNQ